MPKKRKKTQLDQNVEHVEEEVGALGKKMERKGTKGLLQNKMIILYTGSTKII